VLTIRDTSYCSRLSQRADRYKNAKKSAIPFWRGENRATGKEWERAFEKKIIKKSPACMGVAVQSIP